MLRGQRRFGGSVGNNSEEVTLYLGLKDCMRVGKIEKK